MGVFIKNKSYDKFHSITYFIINNKTTANLKLRKDTDKIFSSKIEENIFFQNRRK
jgi:hypothetical protein